MKIVMYLNVISIFFHLTGTEMYNNETLYIPLIKWIRSYYSASAVFLLHSSGVNKNFDDWKLTYLSHTWSRLLHREQIATLSSTFKNIHVLDRNNILRPLAIVLISGPDAVFEFSKYSKSFRISHFAWFVIFVPTAMQAENYCYNPPGNPFNLLYDTEMLVMCPGDPVLREWYSVDGNNTVISDLVKWYPKKQLKSPTAVVDLLSNLSLHERRNDLKGKVLRAVTIKNSIFTAKNDKFEGYFSRAVNELEKYLNFTLDIVSEELEFGSFNVTTKRWNGAFRLVASGEVDIGLSDFSMTNIRLDYVDYTVPIITTRDCLYFKQPETSAVKWLAYYKAYSFALWMSLLVTIIIAQFTLAFIRSRVESTDLTVELYHEFIRIWGIFCQQGITEGFPRYSSLRLAYFTVLVTGIVIFAAYSASMISFVTAYVHNLPFRTIEEFVNDGTYDVILNKDSADYDMFALSKDPVSEHMMAKLRPIHTLPITIEDGFQKVCDDPTLVYYSGYGKQMQGIANFHIPCDIVCINSGRVDSLSLILPKNSQFTSILNYYVQKLLNTGLLNRFKNEVFFMKKNTFQPVGFYSVASVLIIFFGGVSLALVILIVEMYYNRCFCCEMARMTRYAIIILLLLSVSAFSVDINDAYKYVLLIKDVHNYYKTSCIIIVCSNSHTNFNQTSLAYIWLRAFSQRGILTMIVSFSQLSREARKFQGYLTRPLYVVALTTKGNMDEFSMATKQIDMSLSVWLLMFLPYRENPMRDICQNPIGNPFNLMFNTEMLVLCYDLPLLTEWYALRDNQTRIFNLATWQTGQGLKLKTTSSLYARRNNMFGQTIRISIVQESPFVEIKNGILSHFFGRVIRELSKSMNFKIEVTSSLLIYGDLNKDDNTWTGVVGEVASDRADFGVAEFSMTNHRLDIVDFTLPLILSRNRIYFKKPDGTYVQWSAYFKTFKADVWSMIIFVIVTAPIFLTLMKTRGRITMRILADNYIYVWGIYCQQGLSEFPTKFSMRLAFLSIFLSSLIILSAYSASLTSFLTVSTVTLPFSTMEEFANYGSYKLITFRNSADYDMIIAANSSLFEKVKKLMKDKEDLPLTAHDGFLQVCNEKVGFYITEAIKNAINIPCETSFIEADRVDSLALVLKKRGQYTGVVNYYLQQFKDNGVLARLKNTFLVTGDSAEKGNVTVNLNGIAPILSVLAGGAIFSCLVLLLEKICYNFWRNNCGGIFHCVLWRRFFNRQLVVDSVDKKKRIGNLSENILQSQENQRSDIFRNQSSFTQYK